MTGNVRGGIRDPKTQLEVLGNSVRHWLQRVRAGRISLDQAWQRIVEYNAAAMSPPWDHQKLRAIYDAILRKDQALHGPMPIYDFLDEGDRASDGAITRPCFAKVDPAALSDDDLAQRFVERHQGKLRYATARGVWMVWDGSVWRPDETKSIIDRVRRSCRLDAAGTDDKRIAHKISSERVINAVEKLARTDPAVATEAAAWDRDPMRLNTPKGVLDLSTGKLHAHDKSDLYTRIAGASPGGACPTWLRFLVEVTGNKAELITYLQRFGGYCLTGSMVEQVFFFLSGGGANGKSVFTSAMSHVLGDYAATAASDTFTTGTGERHSTDLAGIASARAVFVSETESGKAWAEARIKQITGGDRLRVRFLYKDFFQVDPSFKIVVAGNTRPRLSGVGEAMRRRLHLIPFEVTIPPEMRDKDLVAKLKSEADGIFQWMLEGCLEWQRIGLAPPDCVRDAANAYFSDEDLIGQWLDETCEIGDRSRAHSCVLYKNWSDWADARGFDKGSQRSLGEELRARGFKPFRTGKERGWIGLGPLHMPVRHGKGRGA